MFRKEETIILMALPVESQGLFEKSGWPVHFTGLGKVNAAFAATSLIMEHKPKWVLNLGTAGSHKFKVHELIECSGFVQRDMNLTALGVPLGKTVFDEIPGKIEVPTYTELKKGICGTGDLIEIGPPQLECDLVDMEAYAFAKVCKKMGVGFSAIKYITDDSQNDTKDMWRQNLRLSAEKLFEIAKSFFQKS